MTQVAEFYTAQATFPPYRAPCTPENLSTTVTCVQLFDAVGESLPAELA